MPSVDTPTPTAEHPEVPLPEASELPGSASEEEKKQVINLLNTFTRRPQFAQDIGKRIKLVRVDVQPKHEEPRKLEVAVTTETKVGPGTCDERLIVERRVSP
jgi:hypothetical protein